MKTVKKILIILCSAALLMILSPSAFAEESDASTAEENDTSDFQYGDLSLDEIMDALLAEYNTDADHVFAGYINLVTGEEYYLNADEYAVAASMYKVPLNMRIAEMLNTGELDWESKCPGISYDSMLNDSIVNSSNEAAEFLWNLLGNYAEYRRQIAPYMGLSEDEIDENFTVNNSFTPRQMIHCLELLYDEQERFPQIIETMQKAEPEHYFKYKERRFDIAHKYGYVGADYVTTFATYMNDCGIAFTDEPIAIVMFTKSVPNAEDLLTAYCTAMCEYTQYHAALRRETAKAEEAAAAEKAAEEEANESKEAAESTAPPSPEATASAPLPETEDAENNSENPFYRIVICLICLVLVVLLTVLALIRRKRRREK